MCLRRRFTILILTILFQPLIFYLINQLKSDKRGRLEMMLGAGE